MASYKQPCIHCNHMIDRDVKVCAFCGSAPPFGYHCPDCLRKIEKGQSLCSGCGRTLLVTCPVCKEVTFAETNCEHCGGSLMVRCSNVRCNELQFFELTKCRACGHKIKKKG